MPETFKPIDDLEAYLLEKWRQEGNKNERDMYLTLMHLRQLFDTDGAI